MAKKKPRPMLSAISPASPTDAYEAIYFARKCGLTPDEALRIMREAKDSLKASSEVKRKG